MGPGGVCACGSILAERLAVGDGVDENLELRLDIHEPFLP